jgi:hypothetical protein
MSQIGGHDPVLPERAHEDTDEAWGAAPEERDADAARTEWLRRQRPPHHD